MDNVFAKRREIFFNNLILLGFDKVLFEKKYKISFHKNMFAVSNKKGFEVVTYFLFSKLSEVSGQKYNIPWPLLDREYERIFQKTAFGHLQNFAQENIVKFPLVLLSSVSSFGGERFYELYFAFSNYVLLKSMQKSDCDSAYVISKPEFKKENYSSIKQVLQSSSLLSIKNFQYTERISLNNQDMFERRSKNLLAFLQKIKSVLRANQVLLKEAEENLSKCFSLGENCERKDIVNAITDCSKTLKKMEESLQKFIAIERSLWLHLSSEVDDKYEKYILDGKKYNVGVSPSVCNYTSSNDLTIENSSEPNENLCIVRFIKVFVQCLEHLNEFMKDQIKEPCISENICNQQHSLEFITDFNQKLCDDIIHRMKFNIETFKSVFMSSEYSHFKQPIGSIWPSIPVREINQESVYKYIDLCNIEDMFEANHLENTEQSEISKEVLKGSSSLRHWNESLSLTSDSGLNTDVSQSSCFQDILSPLEFNSVKSKSVDPCLTPDELLCRNEHGLKNDDLSLTHTIAESSFKSRYSLAYEDSLNAETLPDMSFEI